MNQEESLIIRIIWKSSLLLYWWKKLPESWMELINSTFSFLGNYPFKSVRIYKSSEKELYICGLEVDRVYPLKTPKQALNDPS